MKTPEQQAQEWVRTETGWVDKVPSDLAGIPYKETWLCEANDCKRAFLAGHAAGKQEAERRIWAKFVSWMTGPPDDRRLRIVSDELKRIIFGDEKV